MGQRVEERDRGPATQRGVLAAGSIAWAAFGALPLLTLSLTSSLPVAFGLLGALGLAGYAFLAPAVAARKRHEQELLVVLERAATGDVAARVDAGRLGPLANLGRAVNDLAQSHRALHHEHQDLQARVPAAASVLRERLQEVRTGLGEQDRAAEEAAALFAGIDDSGKTIEAEVEALNRATEETSSSILEMGSSVEEVARNTETLHESVDLSTSSLQEIGANVRQMTESTDSVQNMAQESAAAMTEMDETIQEVEEHVGEAARLAEQVRNEAEEGSGEVRATVEGIQKIRSLTLETRQVIERLAGRVTEITEIIDVIGGINDETNLLSLNAAIIAAQAGEQGKAFAVVANRVKTLADRTGSSTQEIARLIHAVQEESSNAVEAMGTGIEAVEVGVDRSRKAGLALDRIRESAENSNLRVEEISRAASEQAKNSKHVAQAAQRTSVMVQQIHTAMGEQSKASEQMLRNAEQALDVCRQVHRSVEEQRSSGRFISESISSIADRVASVQENTANHAKATQTGTRAVERILEVTRRSRDGIPELEAAIEEFCGAFQPSPRKVDGS